MPPGNDVGIGLTKGGVVALGTPSFDKGGGVVAGDVLLLLGGDLLLDRSSLNKKINVLITYVMEFVF